MIEMSQLRCFVAVAEELHFGRGAARLNMTQPPVSRHIQVLERVIGVQLFDRSNRSVRLTPAGKSFLIEARKILRLSQDAALTAKRIASGDAGNISIGFTAASGYSFLPHLLGLAQAQLPNVNLVLREQVTADQIEGLTSGKIDLGLLRARPHLQGIERRRVLSETLVAAVHVSDERAAADQIHLADFDQRPLIMYTADNAGYFHDILVEEFERRDVSPVFTQYMSQIHSMLSLVQANLGAAIVPSSAQVLKFENVAFRPLAEPFAHSAELYLVWKEHSDNPSLRALLDLMPNLDAEG